MDLQAEVALALNPALFAEKILGFKPDEWQRQVLNEKKRDVILNCSRQVGKSTTASVLALHMALYKPLSTTILISPSQRQSAELYDKVYDTFQMLPHRPKTTEESASSLQIDGGGRVISLPASEATIRGYSAVSLVIEDEAARVPDELNAAVKPMLAVSKGRLMLLSSPDKRQGHFYEIWSDKYTFDGWLRIEVPATTCARISQEFLDKEKKELGSRIFAREYMCQFLDEAEFPIFMREWFKGKVVKEVPHGAKFVRRWDLAATKPKADSEPDYTAGALLAKYKGQYFIVHMKHMRGSPLEVETAVKVTALNDASTHGPVMIRMEQEGGSSGINTIDHYAREILDGFDFRGIRTTGSKADRAAPLAAATETGNVFIVEGNWNIRGMIDELCSFPSGEHDDQVDALSGAFFDLQNSYLLPDDPASLDGISSLGSMMSSF